MSPENSNDFESANVSCAMHLQKYRLHKARIENFCKSAKKILWYFGTLYQMSLCYLTCLLFRITCF